MRYVIKAVLASKVHPECGVVSVPLPIPNDEYDHTIELLEGLGIR